MRLTTRSCRLGGTISARMKRWQLSGSTAGYVIGLPAFGLCGVESARDGRRHHRTVCRLPRQSNSDKTHLATICLIPSNLHELTGTNCFSIELARIRILKDHPYTQHYFKLRIAGLRVWLSPRRFPELLAVLGQSPPSGRALFPPPTGAERRRSLRCRRSGGRCSASVGAGGRR